MSGQVAKNCTMTTENLFRAISNTVNLFSGLPLRYKSHARRSPERAFYCDERHITPSLVAGDSSHLPVNTQGTKPKRVNPAWALKENQQKFFTHSHATSFVRRAQGRTLGLQTTAQCTSRGKQTRPKQGDAARFRGNTGLLDGVGETAEASRGDVFVYP